MGRKIVRTKRIYKKHTPNKMAIRTILFILLLALLIGLGFIVSREWTKRFGKNAPHSSMQMSSDSKADTSSGTELTSSTDGASSTPPASLSINTASTIAAHISAVVLQEQQADNYESYFAQVKANGCNTVYAELKTEDGMIHYKTTNEMAIKFGAISEKAVDLRAFCDAAKKAGITPIAQISALKDSKAPHVSNDNSYAYEDQLDINWLDDSVARGGKAWLNPYMDNTRSYISAITKDAVDAGFEAVVLENVMFPNKNTAKMNPVNRNKEFSAILKQVIDEAQLAAGDKPVYVGYHSQPLIKTKEDPYYASAADIGHNKVAVLINQTDLSAVSLHGANDPPMTAEEQVAAARQLLDQAKLIAGEDGSILVSVIADNNLSQNLRETIAAYAFGSIS